MSKGKNKKHSSGRNVQEIAKLAKAIKNTSIDPTMPQNFIKRTLDQSACKDDEEEVNSPRQKSKSRRLHLHLKENWPNYLISLVLSVFGVLFLTMYPKVIRTELTSDDNKQKIDTIEKDIKNTNLRFQEDQKRQDEKILTNTGDIKALRDTFSLYIQLNQKIDTTQKKESEKSSE